ncbi:MAG: hypothetical protein WA814_13345 [Candidatus Baltobacteraceae bacterium]
MAYFTLSIDGSPDDARRGALDELVRGRGGVIEWRANVAAGRSYALLELPDLRDLEAIRETAGGRVYETAIIALAVFPTVPEALPAVLDALGGAGRPAGVVACYRCAGGAIVEWDLDRSPAEVILGLIDVELGRFRSGRTAELLAPLPAATIAAVAAQGLAAPQIIPDRILEVQIARHRAVEERGARRA